MRLLISDGMDNLDNGGGEGRSPPIEKILHKYELEIRAHVKMEQEFKKLAEEAEKKYDGMRNEFNGILLKYNRMIEKLSEMTYENESLTAELCDLRALIADAQDDEQRDSTKKLCRSKFGSGAKDKSVKKTRTSSNDYAKISYNAQKIKSVSSSDVGGEQFSLRTNRQAMRKQFDQPSSQTCKNK